MTRAAWTALLLLITACGSAPRTSVPAIHGQIEWRESWPDAVSYPPIVFLPQTPVHVTADGTFSLPLPTALTPDGTTYASPLCGGDVQQSDPQAAFATLPADSLRVWRQGRPVGSITAREIESGAVRNYQYVYSTAATAIHGAQLCDGVQETFDLAFQQGWNLVMWTQGASGSFTYRSLPNRRLSWSYR